MDSVKMTTLMEIQGDDFAKRTLELARTFLYANYRNWNAISQTGRIPFTSEEAMTLYGALSVLLQTNELPDVGDLKVNVGGHMMAAKNVEMLQGAFKKVSATA